MAVTPTSRLASIHVGWIVIILSVFLVPVGLHAQSTSPQDPSATQKTQSPPPKKPSTAEQFPYPGESPAPSSPALQTDAPTPANPQTPAPNAAKQFPYPGDAPASHPSSSSSSSSSSADPDSTSAPDPDDHPAPADAKQSGRRKLPKARNLQTDEEREAEDLTVARFYRDKGDWDAAYKRGKDAIQYQPDDPDAHLLLAEMAQKLNKRDEAIAEYKAILTLDSSDKQLKSARKALAELQ